MSLTASSQSKSTADFNGNKAGGIETWVYSEVQSQTTTQTTIRFIFGFDQTQSYSDTQDFDAWISGSSVYSSTFTNSKGSDAWQFYETTRTYNRGAYGTATQYHSARARVDGIFNGPTSDTDTHDITTGVPAKAGTVLGAPGGFAVVAVTSSSLRYAWNAPASSGIGPAPDTYALHVATDPGFTNLVFNAAIGNVVGYTVSGLSQATTYYARVVAHNSVGWGTYSPTVAYTTTATVPSAPAAPTVSNPTSSGFTVAFVPPYNGGSAITSYEIWATKDNWATWTVFTATSSPKVLTGLLPGVNYKVAIRAINANGPGGWSADSSLIQTVGGVKIWTGTAWGEGIVRVWDGTTWKVAVVRKWNGSAWVV